MKKSVVVMMLVVGVLMAGGCGGSEVSSSGAEAQADTVNEDSTGNSGQENAWQEDAASDVQVNGDTDEANDAVISQDSAETSNTVQSANPNYINYSGEKYTWNEVTINIPIDWSDKYIIKEYEEGFSIYHKASYEKEEGMGFLCSVERSNEWLNYGAGEALWAYTDDGMLYYLMQPTDVTGYMDDEQIFGEFSSLVEDVTMMAMSIEVNVENCHYDAGQYKIPVSNLLSLEEEDLINMSDNELWIARNEIFARHGRIFRNEYLQSYFDSCSWYQPTTDAVDESALSEIEKDNLDLIIAMEERFAAEHPYPKEYRTGEKYEADITGNGSENVFMYQVTWHEDTDEYDCILTIDDTDYDINDYVYMVSPMDDVFYITDLEENFEAAGSVTDGYEIAVLDFGPSYDPLTYFFKYDGDLRYIGEVSGFPFKEQNNGVCGFSHYSGITSRLRMDLIETTFLNGYCWYNSSTETIEQTDIGIYAYQNYKAHELYVDLPVYVDMNQDSPLRMISAGQKVYFLESDMRNWILVRAKDGTEGYIRVEDGNVLNVSSSADAVFSDLDYFD